MNGSRARLSRRALLRGAGGLAVPLPALASLAPSPPPRTAASARPVIVYFTPNGHPKGQIVLGGSTPQGPASSKVLEPLAAYRSELLVIEGLALRSSRTKGHAGMGALLTGTRPGGGPSLDQHLAKERMTRFPSLELGVLLRPPVHRVEAPHLSWRGPGVPVLPEQDPLLVYDRLFRAKGGGPSPGRLVQRRRSVLDAVGENLAQVRGRLRPEDQIALDQFATSVREVEGRLGLLAAQSRRCEVSPATLPAVDTKDPAQATLIRDTQIDLLLLAIACGLTTVGSIVVGGPDSSLPLSFIDAGAARGASWSAVSDRKDADAVAAHTAASVWCAQGLARLLAGLASWKVPGGQDPRRSLLDEALVLWTTECNPDHSHENVPFLLAGRAGGTLKPGRQVPVSPGTPHNELLVSLCKLSGTDVDVFGDKELCTFGGLAELQ